ncbi:MAG: hypothetical protein Q9160_006809 [Pyrenula sp. 1 TL-2023]
MPPSSPSSRLTHLTATVMSTSATSSTPPWDPNATTFPLRSSLLPPRPNAPAESSWNWGADDELGRLNLLTPARTKSAAATQIQTGEVISLNLPLTVPSTPGFGREPFTHRIKPLWPGIAYDDTYSCNTQSGSQWDGFRHFAHIPSGNFYNGVRKIDIEGDASTPANTKCGVQAWSHHGIVGRAVLIDYWSYANAAGNESKRYDPFTSHAISYSDLATCAREAQNGLDIRPASQGGDLQIGDILLIRTGFVDAYHSSSPERRKAAALAGHHAPSSPEYVEGDTQHWAGIAQSQEMLTWLHDGYFAAVGGDAPAFERWPSEEKWHVHEFVLALWGMPLGEMLDLEGVSRLCRERGRWTFFLSAAPVNCEGGVASWVNANAIF